MRDVVFTSNAERVFPQRLAVFPISGLAKSAHAQAYDYQSGGNAD